MNDSPVDCQNREWTEPQRDRRPLRSRTCYIADPEGNLIEIGSFNRIS